MSKLPEFVATPIEAIQPTTNKLRATFLSHKTRPVEWRLVQLRKLYWGLVAGKFRCEALGLS
jgi:beta-apo-4'-carotenal oxygenase